MKRALPFLPIATFLLASAPQHASAQCPFDPTVTPSDLILCPNSEGVLSTQTYDSYQWYKAGAPIVGETGPTLTVDAYNDAAYYFKVEVTLDSCTEMSPEVLVDGWAFLPPFAMTSDNYLFIDAGTAVFCEGDTAYLVLMPPYDINIQWTNDGTPIPGATDDTLFITTPGNYHVSGAPSLCPDFQQQLGVQVPIAFQEPIQPVIMMGDASMCVMPEGVSYQWYLDGAPIGDDSPCIVPGLAGAYTVDVTYDPDCSLPADPFIISGIDETLQGQAPQVSPIPAQDVLTISTATKQGIGSWFMLDATGRVVLQGNGLGKSAVSVEVRSLRPGAYWLRADGHAAAPVSIVR